MTWLADVREICWLDLGIDVEPSLTALLQGRRDHRASRIGANRGRPTGRPPTGRAGPRRGRLMASSRVEMIAAAFWKRHA